MVCSAYKKPRAITLLLIVLLCSSAFLFIDSPVKAAGDTYHIQVSTGQTIGFRGGTVEVTAYSNASQVTVEIYDPNNQQVYSQVWTANTTRSLPISASADYGTYTIKGIAGSSETTTWFTVLDVSNWVSATFPYFRQHKGVSYSFYANGTILADNGEDVLNIDLSTLRALASSLGLSVSATYNSMNFRVRFTKADFAVDLTFSFVWQGCKFTVNGTLDQARSFSFRVADPSKLKSLVDNVRVGNLVFDYGDLHKALYAFSYDRGTGELSVNVPKTFMLDPTIFASGFETGYFSEFTSETTSGSATNTTQSTVVNSGSYAGNYSTTTNNEVSYSSKTVANSTEYYLRAYYYIADGVDSADIGWLMSLRGTAAIAMFLIYKNATGFYWVLRTDQGGGTNYYYLDNSFAEDTWYCVELYAKVDNTAGAAKLFINGTQLISVSGQDLDNRGNITSVRVGVDYNQGGGVVIVIVDDVEVSDSYIGLLDTTAPTFSAVTANTTVAGAPTQLSCNVTDETAVSGYIFSYDNGNGTWVNGTWTSGASAAASFTWNSTVGNVGHGKVYANDTSNNWAASDQYNFTLTAIYLSLQVRDKDGSDISRVFSLTGTLANGSALSVSTGSDGSYSLATSYGVHAFAVSWGGIDVNSSVSYTSTANASLNLDTRIELYSSGGSYVLWAITGSDLPTATLEPNDACKLSPVSFSAAPTLRVDVADWLRSSEPTYVNVGGYRYDKTNWAFSSGVLTYTLGAATDTFIVLEWVPEDSRNSNPSSNTSPSTTQPDNTSAPSNSGYSVLPQVTPAPFVMPAGVTQAVIFVVAAVAVVGLLGYVYVERKAQQESKPSWSERKGSKRKW